MWKERGFTRESRNSDLWISLRITCRDRVERRCKAIGKPTVTSWQALPDKSLIIEYLRRILRSHESRPQDVVVLLLTSNSLGRSLCEPKQLDGSEGGL